MAVNCCPHFPRSLLESELFGHSKGAFTDARNERKGLFMEAEGGTLFLDEIGEMPTAMQPKLLRALGRKTNSSGRQRSRDSLQPVRLITATNRDLETEIEEGPLPRGSLLSHQCDSDRIASLKARGTDILLLAQNYVRSLCRAIWQRGW